MLSFNILINNIIKQGYVLELISNELDNSIHYKFQVNHENSSVEIEIGLDQFKKPHLLVTNLLTLSTISFDFKNEYEKYFYLLGFIPIKKLTSYCSFFFLISAIDLVETNTTNTIILVNDTFIYKVFHFPYKIIDINYVLPYNKLEITFYMKKYNKIFYLYVDRLEIIGDHIYISEELEIPFKYIGVFSNQSPLKTDSND